VTPPSFQLIHALIPRCDFADQYDPLRPCRFTRRKYERRLPAASPYRVMIRPFFPDDRGFDWLDALAIRSFEAR
jgi:hypothetical protein